MSQRFVRFAAPLLGLWLLGSPGEVTAGWFISDNYRPASETRDCGIIGTETAVAVILKRSRDGQVTTGVIVGDHDPTMQATLKVGGNIRESEAGGVFRDSETEAIIIDMLVDERLWVEWYPWPSGFREGSELLRDFPLAYMACREAVGLPVGETLIRIVEERDEGLRFLRKHGLATSIVTKPYPAYQIELFDGSVKRIGLQLELGEARRDLVRQSLELLVEENVQASSPPASEVGTP